MLTCLSVLTMYWHSSARGVNHEWRASSTGLGELSYVYAVVYRRLGGPAFTSLSSETLGCATFVQLTPANILLSLAGYPFTRSPMPLANNQSHQLVSLPLGALKIWEELTAHQEAVDVAVTVLKKDIKSKNPKVGEDGEGSEVDNNLQP
jgi:hypothetical protein